MRNVMIVDGALNCAYDIFGFEDDEFARVFQGEQQDVAFIEDLLDAGLDLSFLDNVWKRRLDKKTVTGIHGTLFYELYEKRTFYPSLRESDLNSPPLDI